MRVRHAAVALAVAVATLVSAQTSVRADDDDPSIPEETRDVAIPGADPVDTRPSSQDVGQPITLAAVVAGPVTEDFRYDPQKTKGKASEVCSGGLLTGSGWTFWEIVDRFGGTAGTMYSCRERWDAANDPDCNGTISNPSSSFYSTCWSNHAAGRAIDVMVGGSASSGYNRTRGLNIVSWLLAKDGYGNVNANARRLGIQQILFDDRCWNSEGDRGIANWNGMRECGIGHHDHVHIDLTIDGANGAVSYWGAPPRALTPKPDTQVLWDYNSAWRQAVSWHNLQESDEEGVAIPAGYDRALVGDWDGDRVTSEVFLWNVDNGAYIIQEWNDGDSLNATMGQFTYLWTDAVAGDFDNDGAEDDMILWDRKTGTWVAESWYRDKRTRRATGKLWNAYDDWISGDFDGDGHVDDTLIWDHDAGWWRVQSWHSFGTTFHNSGRWPTGYDDLIVGDWNAGGDMDEAILWDQTTGNWLLQEWSHFSYTNVSTGRWGNYLDVAAPGDYDTDGRVDDLYVYDDQTGRWWIYSFHRHVMTGRRSGTWAVGFDQVSVGALNE